MDRGSGRGLGYHRGYPGRSGGRRGTVLGWSSRGRGMTQKYVVKEVRKSQEPVAGISPDVNSSVDLDSAQEKVDSHPQSAPESCGSLSEERPRVAENPFNLTGDKEILVVCPVSKLDLSTQPAVETITPLKHGDKGTGISPLKGPETPVSDGKSVNSEVPFDICPPKISSIHLVPSLYEKNKEIRRGMQPVGEQMNGELLRPGMVLLKGYISLSDQVKIVKRCRELGLGPGGFYEPGYLEGAKMHLKMMCLGKNWDPQRSSYTDRRPTDDAKPPDIPLDFYNLVHKALKDAHSIKKNPLGAGKSEEQLPWMTPDICIVNFYKTSGSLGLHQDRDESSESISKGLPVVSFSIGDSADFLYGTHGNDHEKVVLESGDVLIFGGKSRRVFHGVSAIKPNSAPKTLLEKTDLRAGRLNLTFRQY